MIIRSLQNDGLGIRRQSGLEPPIGDARQRKKLLLQRLSSDCFLQIIEQFRYCYCRSLLYSSFQPNTCLLARQCLSTDESLLLYQLVDYEKSSSSLELCSLVASLVYLRQQNVW